jgi:hypothetical protein
MKIRPSFCAAIVLWPALLHAQSGVEELRITVGKSIVLDYPTDIAPHFH